ncbi:amino acid racemase [Alteromonas sp. 345S023]|uniref:Amino acid racemase n=1 Tax=Alteromonas profundi TaxID=2696062 RepID=A0A7X5LK14_9ALTE|nr:aspartate/glutamate racemase family protein [Alteromonas profundi]NDV90791.1 amino acid racemase [Alteromonas profundi]
MKTLGLIGGMSWESSVTYYQQINRLVNQALGELHSAKLCLYSVDFNQVAHYQNTAQWHACAQILIEAAHSLVRAGAEAIVICTNTMHKVAHLVAEAIDIPLLHIADATGLALQKDHIKRVGLLGTAFTMEDDFYTSRLVNQFSLDVLTPSPSQRPLVHDIIYTQLCKGVICDQSRTQYIEIINDLNQRGAQGIILGCTEIGLLINQTHTEVPLYDTAAIHAQAAVAFALEQ